MFLNIENLSSRSFVYINLCRKKDFPKGFGEDDGDFESLMLHKT